MVSKCASAVLRALYSPVLMASSWEVVIDVTEVFSEMLIEVLSEVAIEVFTDAFSSIIEQFDGIAIKNTNSAMIANAVATLLELPLLPYWLRYV